MAWHHLLGLSHRCPHAKLLACVSVLALRFFAVSSTAPSPAPGPQPSVFQDFVTRNGSRLEVKTVTAITCMHFVTDFSHLRVGGLILHRLSTRVCSLLEVVSAGCWEAILLHGDPLTRAQGPLPLYLCMSMRPVLLYMRQTTCSTPTALHFLLRSHHCWRSTQGTNNYYLPTYAPWPGGRATEVDQVFRFGSPLNDASMPCTFWFTACLLAKRGQI